MNAVNPGDLWGEARGGWRTPDWLGAHTLETLYECNERFLALLQSQALQSCGLFNAQVATLLRELDPVARARAARCAVLLADPGFADAGRWQRALDGAAPAQEYGAIAGFAPEGAVETLRVILTCAGHLVHSDAAAARLFMAMAPGCIEAFAGCTVTRVASLATTHWCWLRPRWPARTAFWTELLQSARVGTATAQAQLQVRGLMLLAGEVRP